MGWKWAAGRLMWARMKLETVQELEGIAVRREVVDLSVGGRQMKRRR